MNELVTNTLNVAAWLPRSWASGPGERFVLWVQGCPFRCLGCINDSFLEFEARRHMSVDEIEAVIAATPGIEGVTFSGGEPMAQAKGLYELSCRLQARGLSIFCYSGFTIEELRRHNNSWTERLLSLIDVLVDGKYEASQRANLPWRGSRNQRVHFLSDRYRSFEAEVNRKNADIDIIVGARGYAATGILHQTLLERLRKVMEEDSR